MRSENSSQQRESSPNDSNVSDAAKRGYHKRLNSLRKARNYMAKNDVARAVKFYREYLSSVSAYFQVQEVQLHPKFFKHEKNGLPEMLMISHVYWDLARIYDLSSDLQDEALRCLDQFVLFTVGHKFQHANSRMVKKFLKRSRIQNRTAFEKAYQKVYVKPKGCYIATMCFGETSPHLKELRKIRDNQLSQNQLGKIFIRFYYLISPKIVGFLAPRPLLRKVFVSIHRPLIRLFIILAQLIGKKND